MSGIDTANKVSIITLLQETVDSGFFSINLEVDYIKKMIIVGVWPKSESIFPPPKAISKSIFDKR